MRHFPGRRLATTFMERRSYLPACPMFCTAAHERVHVTFARRVRKCNFPSVTNQNDEQVKRGTLIPAEDLDESHARREISAPPDAIGIIWIDLNPSWVRLGIRKWELHPLARLGIEASDFVRLLFAHPDQIIFPVHAHGNIICLVS